MNITIQMFGAFRALGDALVLDMPNGATIKDLRPALQQQISGMNLDDLLQLSKFANEQEILTDISVCEDGWILAILPPVSGG